MPPENLPGNHLEISPGVPSRIPLEISCKISVRTTEKQTNGFWEHSLKKIKGDISDRTAGEI